MGELAQDLAACVEALEPRKLRIGGVVFNGDPEVLSKVAWFVATHAPAIAELQARCERAEADAAVGGVVWRFIDRMNDVCDADPAEKVLAEFVAAIEPAICAAIDANRKGEGNG